MAQRRSTRTIHTIEIDLQDDMLAGVEVGDEVEFVLRTREGWMTPRKLNYRDLERLMGRMPSR